MRRQVSNKSSMLSLKSTENKKRRQHPNPKKRAIFSKSNIKHPNQKK